MNITLINTNSDFWSLGIRKLAGYLRSLGHRVRVVSILNTSNSSFVDFILHRKRPALDFSQPEAKRRLNAFLAGEDIIGVSTMSVTFCLRTAKSILDNIEVNAVVGLGGFHAMSNPEDAIQMNVDFVCTTEGELPMKAMIDTFKDGKIASDVPGMWCKDRATGTITRNGKGAVITDVDQCPFPVFGYEDVYVYSDGVFRQATPDDYKKHYGNGMRVVSSYGCPFICSYCQSSHGLEGGKVRFHSPEYVVNMVKHVHDLHPFFESVVFYDDSFFSASAERIDGLAALYKEQVGLPIVIGGVFPNLLSEAKLAPMVDAGLTKIYMGLQSGSERLLVKYYHRKTPFKNIARAISMAHAQHPRLCLPNLDVIVGNPAETEEDRRQTLETLLSLPRPYSISLFHLMHIPNTPLTHILLKEGLITQDDIDKSESYKPKNPGTYEILIAAISGSRIPAGLVWFIYNNFKFHSNALYTVVYLWGMFKVVARTIMLGYNAQLPYGLSQAAKWINPSIQRRIMASPIKRDRITIQKSPVSKVDQLKKTAELCG